MLRSSVSQPKIVSNNTSVDQTMNDLSKKKSKPTKSNDHQINEWIKCRSNVLYFILNYCYIEETGGRIKYSNRILHPKLRRVVRSTVKYHSAIFMASRQLGKSTIAGCLLAWASIFFPRTYSIVLNFQKKVGYGNLSKVRFVIDNLPTWMKVPYASKSERKTYIELMNGSKIDIFYPSTVSKPETLARSLTAPILYIDEAAYINHMDKIYGSAQQTLATARQQAAKNNYPYFTLVTSTPNGTTGAGEWFYKRWNGALESSDVFTQPDDQQYEDWIEDDISYLLDNPSVCNGFIKTQYHWSEDPNKDEQWYHKQCQELDDKRLINQELDLMFVGTQYCIFDDELLLNMKTKEKAEEKLTIPSTIIPNAWFDLFVKPENLDPTDYYLVGIDTASSMRGAYNAIEVFGFRKFEQIAEFNYKINSLNKYGQIIDYFFRWLQSKVGDRIILCFENNSVGKAPIEDLLENIRDINYANFIFTEKEKYPGITTTGINKDFMIGCFIEYLNENPKAIKSRKLFNQLSSIEKTASGTIQSKNFTDMFMACCFCAMVRKKKALEIMPLVGLSNEKIQEDRSQLYNSVIQMNNPKNNLKESNQEFVNPFKEVVFEDDPLDKEYQSYKDDLMKEQIRILSDIF